MIIGLTGPTGSGKSTLSRLAADFNFEVIDCDKEARLATEKGSEGLGLLCREFGEEILLYDGSLNRKKLAELAFATEKDTERLNKTILPVVLSLIKEKIDYFEQRGHKNILLDAPTLYESGAEMFCDVTVAVLSELEHRKSRILARDNLSINDAKIRLSASKPDSFYKDRVDHIIYNNGEFEEFLAKCRALLLQLTEKA